MMHYGLMKLHRVLAFLTSLPLLLVCISGASLSFSDEIDRALNPDLRNIPPVFNEDKQHAEQQLLDTLKMVQHHYSNMVNVFLPMTPYDSLRVDVIKSQQRWELFYNPNSGQFLGERRYQEALPIWLQRFHQSLMLGELGSFWIKVTTPIFTLMLILGFVLWLKKHSKNQSWHTKLGWISFPVILLILMTANLSLWTNLSFGPQQQLNIKLEPINLSKETLTRLLVRCPSEQKPMRLIGKPHRGIEMLCQNNQDYGSLTQTHWLIRPDKMIQKTPHQRVEDWLWALHSGQVLGLPTRMIWMWVSLIPLFLFWTGWQDWRRKNN